MHCFFTPKRHFDRVVTQRGASPKVLKALGLQYFSRNTGLILSLKNKEIYSMASIEAQSVFRIERLVFTLTE